jgi:hypothetical protein
VENIIKQEDRTIIINGGNPLKGCPESYEEANSWADKVNEQNKNRDNKGGWGQIPKWSFDCGFKLDYDGPVVGISSRFFPPKTHYGPKWDGGVSVFVFGKLVAKKQFEEDDIEKLRKEVEKYVRGIAKKIKNCCVWKNLE